MNDMLQTPARNELIPEKVAYWYFRLNGFLQIENFIVHPERHGSQRTDADLLSVRFPHRAERAYDNPNDIMADDESRLSLSRELIDVVIAEVKGNQPCTLNGPWKESDRRNVHRVLAAIGCLPHELISEAAADIYKTGLHISKDLRVRLVAVGRCKNKDLADQYPQVTQVTWPELLAFIWQRFRTYRRQKTQVEQWDGQGKRIKKLADRLRQEDFVKEALERMGVRTDSLAEQVVVAGE